MKLCMERLWTNMNAMPGPVWVFGTWSLCRFVLWFVGILLASSRLLNGGGLFTIGMSLLVLAGHLLALWCVWSLVYQKAYARSFAMWYAGLKAVAIFFLVLVPQLQFFGFDIGGSSSVLVVWPLLIIQAGLWFALLYYLERSEAMEKLFPKQSRRSLPWWVIVPMVALVLGMNL